MPISRRYRADKMFQVKRLNGKFATDTLFSDCKSLSQNTCGQVCSHKYDFTAFYPLPSESGEKIGSSFLDFIHEFGAPATYIFDGHKYQVGLNTKFQKLLRKYDIPFI